MSKPWVYCCYIVVALLVYLNYSLLRLRGIKVSGKNDMMYPPLLDKRRQLTRAYTVTYETGRSCCNALLCPIEGRWDLKQNTTIQDLNRAESINMELRTLKGWPAQLFHGDSRCGTMYPLPRLIRQQHSKKELYLQDVISQCNSFSHSPCCRDDIGWCGSGDFFCQCDRCFNYNNIVHTELYNWKHKMNCMNVKLEKKETCDFLAGQYTSVSFIGDSLVRHVFSSLLIRLTENPESGALKSTLSRQEKLYCSHDNQFVDSSCHSKLSTEWTDVKSHTDYCNTSTSKPKVVFVQAYATHLTELALRHINEKLSEQRPLIFVGIGIHDNFDHEKVIAQYLSPIVQLRNERAGYSNPILVWLNTHAAGQLKPIGYQKTQGNARIVAFNTELREYCRRNSVYVFDTYNMTQGVHSFDGTHYGQALNKLKVDLLVNSLEMLSRTPNW